MNHLENPEAMSCRLFFALWPDDATRAAFLDLQGGLRGGRPVSADNLHLTLAFLGQQPASLLLALRALPSRWADFDCLLQFDRLGYFNRPRIAWAGMRNIPQPLIDLRLSVLAALAETGVTLPDHDSFVPHVSLMRDAEPPQQGDVAAIAWRAQRVVLVKSTPRPGGSQYRVVSDEGK